MTTGRINQVDIVPPSEEQPRKHRTYSSSLDGSHVLKQPRRIALTLESTERTTLEQPRKHRTYMKHGFDVALTQAASTNRTYTPGGGFPNSFATEC